MSDTAIDYQVSLVTVKSIHSDDSFNCRGVISAFDVSDLSKDISKNSLQVPITVQPADDVDGGLPEGKDFRIIAGHRRFKAWRVLQAGWAPGDPSQGGKAYDGKENPYDTIPVMVKTGLGDIEARILNIAENVQRSDLSILQEARAIKHLREAGVPRDHVASELNMSSGWVQTRYYLLDLPEEVQLDCDAGLINQAQIKQLYSYVTRGDENGLFEAVKLIKEKKRKGEKPVHVGIRKKASTNVKKARKRVELFEMIQFMQKSKLGSGVHTRALAWASGEITTDDLFETIREWHAEHDHKQPTFPSEF